MSTLLFPSGCEETLGEEKGAVSGSFLSSRRRWIYVYVYLIELGGGGDGIYIATCAYIGGGAYHRKKGGNAPFPPFGYTHITPQERRMKTPSGMDCTRTDEEGTVCDISVPHGNESWKCMLSRASVIMYFCTNAHQIEDVSFRDEGSFVGDFP